MQPGKPLIDFAWIFDHLDDIWEAILQHLQLTIIPLLLGIIISLALAVWAVRNGRVDGPITLITGLLYTIPSLAAFAVLRPITGLSLAPPDPPDHLHPADPVPRLRRRVQRRPGDIIEAAEGMGYTRRQRLLRVELPLAVPLMIAGIRLASVTSIGLATVVSVLGEQFGGLGQLITDGIQKFFPTEYLLGAALSVILAFAADALFVRAERLITPWAHTRAGAR